MIWGAAIKEWEGVDRLFCGLWKWMLSSVSVKNWFCVLYALCLCTEPIKFVESGGGRQFRYLLDPLPGQFPWAWWKEMPQIRQLIKAELYILQIALCPLLSRKIPCSNYVYKDQSVICPSQCKEDTRKRSFSRNCSIKLMWGNGWRENNSNSV